MRRLRHSTDELEKPVGTYLACPFYRLDPIRYRNCLLRHKLGSTSFTVQHLKRNHSQPPHCAKCGLEFKTAKERDEHTRTVTCECKEFALEGVSESQFQELQNTPRILNESERWYRIWAILFPNVLCHGSPYVMSREDEILTLVAAAIDIRFGQTGSGLVSEILQFLTWENVSATIGNGDAYAQLQPQPQPLPLTPESMTGEWNATSRESSQPPVHAGFVFGDSLTDQEQLPMFELPNGNILPHDPGDLSYPDLQNMIAKSEALGCGLCDDPSCTAVRGFGYCLEAEYLGYQAAV